MRLAFCVTSLLMALMLQLQPSLAEAQVITAGPDSVVIPTIAAVDTAQKKQFFLSSFTELERPERAALLSAIIPGLGQAYNRSYWKIPIIYAGGAVLGYSLVTNNAYYHRYKTALLARKGGSKTDEFATHPTLGVNQPNGTQNLAFYHDGYRRDRDLTIIVSVAAWGLNMAEAYVDAHLKEIDVSEDLSFRLHPNIINVPAPLNVTPALTLTVYSR